MNHAVNDGSVYLLSSLFPIVLTVFGLSVIQVGILVGVGYLISVIGQPIVGRYSERADPRKLMAVGIAIISASVLSFVVSTGFYSLLASVVLLRVGSSFYHPVGVSAVSKAYSGTGLERAMGIQSAFGNMGILFVFVSAAPIYLALGWKATFVLFAIVGAVDVAVTLGAFKIPQADDPPPPKVEASQAKGRSPFGIPTFFLATAFVSGGSYAVVLNYGNLLLETQGHIGVFLANLAVSGWILLAFLGAISTGRWPLVIRRPVLLSLTYFVSAATIVVLSVVSSNLLFAVPLLLINGFALSATYPMTYSELSDFLAVTPETKGRSFGAIFSAQTIGGSALGLAAGYLSTAYGFPSAFLVAGVLLLLGSVMALAWARRSASPAKA